MGQDSKSRKFQLTINNPLDSNFDHDKIKAILESMKSVVYFCMADEIGLETKTPHTHLYIALKSPARFSTIKKRFPEAHIEQAHGTHQQNRDYVAKSGKWADDPKADTSTPGTFEEYGDMPDEPGQGYRSDIAAVYTMIADGKSNAEIMALNPDYAAQIGRMDKIRQELLEAQYRDTFRELSVTYLFGPTETGKTRNVMEKHGYSNTFRAMDYSHPFDRYNSEPVIVFEEFRSSLPIGDMLTYLEGYPLNLPARYAPRVACFETVYIISNIDLRAQYPNIQEFEPSTWKAFLRRIHNVIEYRAYGPPIEHGPALDYVFPPPPKPDPILDTWQELTDDETGDLPF